MTWLLLLSLAVPFLISLLATAWIRRWAQRRQFVDLPGGHKVHLRPVALGGGVAIFLAVLLPIVGGLLLAVALYFHEPGGPLAALAERVVGSAMLQPLVGGAVSKTPLAFAILGVAAVIHALGLLDDRHPIRPAVKLAVEFAGAAVLVVGFDLRAAEFLGPVLSSLLTILWLVIVINAMNLLDNMDGLAAGVALIAAAVLAATGIGAGQIFVPVLCCILAGALVGFLPYNFPPASVFMGDAGSLLIGYLLAVLTVLTTYYDPRLHMQPYGFFLPLVVLAVPLYDVATVLWHRRQAGAPLFSADRRHFSHRLVARGMRPRLAVLTIYLATAATALPAILLPRAPWPAAVVIFAQCLCILLIVAVLEHAGSHANST